MAKPQRNRSSRQHPTLPAASIHSELVRAVNPAGNEPLGARGIGNDAFAVELLEKRVFLSTSALAPSKAVRFVPTSTSVADTRRGPLAAAGSTLANLYIDYRKAQTNNTLSSWTTPLSKLVVIKTGANGLKTVAVTIRATGNLNAFTTRMRALGMQVISSSTTYGVIGGNLPIARLRDAVADKSTLSVLPVYKGFANASTSTLGSAQGVADNSADEGQFTDVARTDYGLDGQGITVGVLSGSVDQFGNGLQGSAGTGDLPSDVKVIQDGSAENATDEGRAMLELIHDIVPAAELQFATTEPDQLNFAANIRRLAAAGSDILVDDVQYFDEPFFQPGVIDDAIHDVREQGIPYLSAVGNYTDGGFEQEASFEQSGSRTFIDFDPGTGVSTQMRINLTDFTPIALQWDNPYNGVAGNATSDLVLRLYQVDLLGNKTLAYIQDDNNLATGKPVEILFPTDALSAFAGVAPGQYYMEIEAKSVAPGASLPTRYKFVTRNALGTVQFAGTRSGTFGHNAGEDTISVGAVFFDAALPFSGTLISEVDSSIGPVTHLFDANGNRLGSPLELQKPDISGVDGSNTSFFNLGNDSGTQIIGGIGGGGVDNGDIPEDADQYPNFIGTSAAAPNVAAAVAQLLQADPTLTPDEIENLLETTATPLNGAPQGEYDPQGGFGLINALDAVNQVIQPAVGDIINVTPEQSTAPVSNIYIKFNQLITGLSKSDITLTRNGGSNLIDETVSLTSPDGITYRLNHLETVTATPGTYTLTIDGGAGGLTSGFGAAFTDILTDTFTILEAPPIPTKVANVRADAVNSSSIRVRFSDYQAEEDNFIVERSTDSQFSSGYRKFVIAADSTQFIDTGLAAGKRYYYRVSARNETGTGAVSAAATAITLARGEIILDNSYATTHVTSGFKRRTGVDGLLGGDYVIDTGSVKGGQTVTFNPLIQAEDEYFVYAKWPKLSGNSSKVPFTIRHIEGGKLVSTIVYVNEQNTGNTWVLLGKFKFAEGAGQTITVSTGGTVGNVVVDSIRLIPSKVATEF